jgi:hypothetical protein
VAPTTLVRAPPCKRTPLIRTSLLAHSRPGRQTPVARTVRLPLRGASTTCVNGKGRTALLACSSDRGTLLPGGGPAPTFQGNPVYRSVE